MEFCWIMRLRYIEFRVQLVIPHSSWTFASAAGPFTVQEENFVQRKRCGIYGKPKHHNSDFNER